MNKLSRRYLAGLFDGEGGFRISRGGGNPSRMCKTTESSMTLYTQIVNTDKAVLEKVQQQYGGGVYANNNHSKHPERKHWRQGWAWVAAGKDAAKFTADIIPFLEIKLKQAEACLTFAETYHKPWRGYKNGLTPEAVKLRNIAFRAFRAAIENQCGRGLSWQLPAA